MVGGSRSPGVVGRRPGRLRTIGLTVCRTLLACVLIISPSVGAPNAAAAADLPPVIGPDPSADVAAFYYPWYGDTTHWADAAGTSLAADDIASDYYPLLGPYDSLEPAIVARHMAWLRAAGIGMIVSSWWGQGSREDGAVPVLLQMAERYGLKVAFHLEDYGERTATRLAEDVAYLNQRYGSSPAFFRMTAWTPFDRRTDAQGLFFLWAPEVASHGGEPVAATYWREGIDAIHASRDGGLVVASTTDATWIEGAHLDGLYDYVAADGRFAWARTLPPGALYVPSVAPGFSARRIGYPLSTDFPRDAGATYDAQWKAALGTGVEPALVTVTSFNEWHEGTQIEPAAPGHVAATGRRYLDYAPLEPDGYLQRTRTWVTRLAATRWPVPVPARITIRTTSDWTTVRVTGPIVARPRRVALSGSGADASLDGALFTLLQPLPAATIGKAVTTTWDVDLIGVTRTSRITVRIERGSLGSTTVKLANRLGPRPVVVAAVTWSGSPGGRNPRTVVWPGRLLVEPPPTP